MNTIFHVVFLCEALQSVALINAASGIDPDPKQPKTSKNSSHYCHELRPPSSCEDFPPLDPFEGYIISPPPAWTTLPWAPLPDDTSIINKIVISSCNSQTDNQDHWNKMAVGTDLSILLGDNVYGDCTDRQCTNLDMAYFNLTQSTQFGNFAANVPVVATWDDHDFGINDGGADFPFKQRAKELFLKFYDVPTPDKRREQNRGIHTSYMFGPPGKTLQVILLDIRWYKGALLPTPQRDIPGFERYIPNYDPLLTVLGNEQWEWLEGELQKEADIRLLATSFQLLSESHGYESWRAAPLEQNRLIRLCESARPRPYILSGDRHFSGIYKKLNLIEITSSSLTNTDWSHPSVNELNDPLRVGPIFEEDSFAVLEANWTDHTVSYYFQPV